jgi:predicted small metal-binding protein
MKRFRCGDVVPGCDAEFTGSDQDILAAVGAHAHADHQISQVGPDLVEAVRSAMVTV